MPAVPRPPDQTPRSARPARRPASGSTSRAGGSGPGRSGSTSRGTRPAGSTTARTRAGAERPVVRPAKPRLTGRAAILVLVLAVLAVSYASSLRAYLQQRGELDSLQSTIAQRQDEIADLEQEKARWLDPEFVRTEARERLGYVMPGETPFVVLSDGEPLALDNELTDPDTLPVSVTAAFWDDAWETMLIAGNPQRRADPPPLTKIEAPEGTDE